MATEHSSTTRSKKSSIFSQGVRVFVVLAILTAVEFFVSRVTDGSAAILLVIGMAKAGLILYYFMHIYSLWREEGH